jgi:long-chain acyl-CoA synthetase
VDAPGEARQVDAGDDLEAPAAGGDSPPVLLLYTSGSTGRPKRVVRTHAHLAAEVETLLDVFEVSPADRFLGAAPFSHVNGLTRTMLSSVVGGATLYPVPRYSRRPVLRLLAGEKLTFFCGVPHMFILLAQTRTREEADVSNLRLVFCSSAPLTPQDNRSFHERYGIWVRQLYGSSETGTISMNDEPDPGRRLATVGRALPGVEVTVLTEEGQPAPPDAEGEIAIRSPFAITSYEGNEEATRKSFVDGLYLSGDVGTIDGEGFVSLVGRKSLMINRGGFKVNPYEVEEAIRQQPDVADVAVVGAPGPHGDQIVRAVVVAGGAVTAEEIAVFCRERIADYKVPSRIEFRDALPKSAAGKVLRHEL